MSLLEIENGISANIGEDFSLSICQGKNLVFLKPPEAVKFKQWLNEAIV